MKVLLVEDEVLLASESASFLRKAGYSCELAYTLQQARKKMEENGFDFILIDLGLPDGSGFQLLKEAREYCPDAAFLILTARGDLEDRIKGLDEGADDYLAKPFSLLELQSRMQAIARRRHGVHEAVVPLGDFTLHLNKRTLFFQDQEVALSKKEFDLLNYLVLHKNKPLTRMQLSDHIWGGIGTEAYDSNYIDVHIKNIRKKLQSYSDPVFLQTVRGIGYKVKL
jgi:two-component system OmpR family response regulator